MNSSDLKRITNANGAFYALFPVLNSQSILRAEIIKFYKAVRRSVATYGAEYRALKEVIAKRLATLQRKVLE
jgi:hypothetical protein